MLLFAYFSLNAFNAMIFTSSSDTMRHFPSATKLSYSVENFSGISFVCLTPLIQTELFFSIFTSLCPSVAQWKYTVFSIRTGDIGIQYGVPSGFIVASVKYSQSRSTSNETIHLFLCLFFSFYSPIKKHDVKAIVSGPWLYFRLLSVQTLLTKRPHASIEISILSG